MPSPFQLQWSKKLPNPPRGLSVARERGHALVWDRHGWVYLFDHSGRLQGQARGEGEIHTAAISEDGEWIAVVDRGGRYRRLGPDLAPRTELVLPCLPTAWALDPFGRHAAFASEQGELYLLDELGQIRMRCRSTRPLQHLVLVPGSPFILGAGDPGLVARFDLGGKCTWQETVVSNIGCLSVDGVGKSVLLACFTAGIQRFDPGNGTSERIDSGFACRWVGQSLDGNLLLAGGLSRGMKMLDVSGKAKGEVEFESSFRFLAASGNGTEIWAGLEDGKLEQYRFEGG